MDNITKDILNYWIEQEENFGVLSNYKDKTIKNNIATFIYTCRKRLNLSNDTYSYSDYIRILYLFLVAAYNNLDARALIRTTDFNLYYIFGSDTLPFEHNCIGEVARKLKLFPDFVTLNGTLLKYIGVEAVIDVPDTITSIWEGAFEDTVKAIGVQLDTTFSSSAFSKCPHLRKIDFKVDEKVCNKAYIVNKIELLKDTINCSGKPEIFINGISFEIWKV